MNKSAWLRLTEWPLLAASLAFLVAYSIEVIGDLPESRSTVFNWVIWGTWALFVIDYIANLILAERRGRWFLANIYRLPILLLPALRPLRLLRLLTLLGFMQGLAGTAFRGRLLMYVLTAASVLTYVGALAVLDAEQNVPHANIHNFGDAMWWAIVTIATVGYGDFYPVTLTGRCVAVALMVGGIAILGIVTATLASWLIEEVTHHDAETIHTSDETLRTEIADLGQKLDRLTRLVGELTAPNDRQV